jgi:hypothetical protein
VISLQDIEQFIPFLKPLFDGLRSAKELFKREPKKESDHSIDIPKMTLILLPGIHPNAMLWGFGKVGEIEGIQISGHIQATNTSKYHIKIAGVKLVEPRGGEVVTHMATVEDPESGMHSSDHMIMTRSIGEVSVMFFVIPVPREATRGQPLSATVALTDQFGNSHVSEFQFRYIGPAQ